MTDKMPEEIWLDNVGERVALPTNTTFLTKYMRADLVEEKDKIIQVMREALEESANEDYRGNRSSASVRAYKALKEAEGLEQ